MARHYPSLGAAMAAVAPAATVPVTLQPGGRHAAQPRKPAGCAGSSAEATGLGVGRRVPPRCLGRSGTSRLNSMSFVPATSPTWTGRDGSWWSWHGHVLGTGPSPYSPILLGDDMLLFDREEHDAGLGMWRALPPGDPGRSNR